MTRCLRRPTAAEPIVLDCPECDNIVPPQGPRCRACDGKGQFEIADCPLKVVPPAIWDAMDLAAMLREGLPPAAGGMLDQAHAFLRAARFLWREEDQWKERQRQKK